MSTARKKSAASRKKTTAQKLKQAQRARDIVPIYLFGDLRSEWKRVKSEFDQAKARDVGMLQQSAQTKDLARQLEALETKMREHTIEVEMEALRRVRTPSTPDDAVVWVELVEEHPPRKDKEGRLDPLDSIGVNTATFCDALVRASIVDLDEEQIDALFEVITDGQFDALFEAAWRLNKSKLDIPFSFAASKTLHSDAESKRPNDSASAPDDSEDGPLNM